MSCNWVLELWNQYDAICAHIDSNIKVAKKTSTFVRARIQEELSHAEKLMKTCKAYKREDDLNSKYTMRVGYGTLVSETNDLAGQGQLMADYLRDNVYKPLRDLAKATQAERKLLMREGANVLRFLKETMDMLERCKSVYFKAHQDEEVSERALVRASQDPESSKIQIHMLVRRAKLKAEAADEAKTKYVRQLESANKYCSLLCKVKMSKLMNDLIDLNTRHLERYKAILDAYSECHRQVFPVIDTCLNNSAEAAEAVDPIRDNKRFICKHKTPYPIPGPIQFKQYSGNGSSVAQRDYSHLPPLQRRKKLLQEIDRMEQIYRKALSNKVAREKKIICGYYQKGPEQVAKKLIATYNMIEKIKAELVEFRQYLAKAEEDCAFFIVSPPGEIPKRKSKTTKQ